MSSYSPPKFFKIIQNHELQNGEIRVPKKFVEIFWKGIENPVVIILPNGVQQKLFWVRRDGDIWFQKNWDKIAKFLKFGNLVVFEHIGGQCFQLKIFGLDCLEIDYSNIKFIAEDEVVSDESEIPAKYQRTKIGNRKLNLDFDTSSESDENDIAGTSDQKRKRGSNKGGKNKKAAKCSTSKINQGIGTSRRMTNPSFELKISQTYATGYLFRIPINFSRKYMKGVEGKAKIRKVGEDRTWKLEVKYDHKGDYSYVNSGWKPFAKEYNLQVGDVCKFEMTRSEPFYFTITITRESDQES